MGRGRGPPGPGCLPGSRSPWKLGGPRCSRQAEHLPARAECTSQPVSAQPGAQPPSPQPRLCPALLASGTLLLPQAQALGRELGALSVWGDPGWPETWTQARGWTWAGLVVDEKAFEALKAHVKGRPGVLASHSAHCPPAPPPRAQPRCLVLSMRHWVPPLQATPWTRCLRGYSPHPRAVKPCPSLTDTAVLGTALSTFLVARREQRPRTPPLWTVQGGVRSWGAGGRQEVAGAPGQPRAPVPSGHIWQVLLPSAPRLAGRTLVPDAPSPPAAGAGLPSVPRAHLGLPSSLPREGRHAARAWPRARGLVAFPPRLSFASAGWNRTGTW